MKTLLSSKTLFIALFTIVLTACGGSGGGSNDDDDNSSSSAPSSTAASSSSATVVSSSAVTSVATSSTATSEAVSSAGPSAALVIYEEDILANWKAWDCCGNSTPMAATASEVGHGKVVKFEINGSTVVGFTSRAGHGAQGGTAFNATNIKTTGTITFDLKMTQAPTAGVGVWKFKVESNGGQAPAGSAAEVNLSSSNEGHSAPVLDTWQTYTFDIADLETAGVNVSALDVFMVFPAWGTGDGAEFEIDNVKIWATGAGGSSNTSSTASSEEASSTATSEAASSTATSEEASSTATSEAASSTATSEAASSTATSEASSSSAASSPSAALVIYEEDILDNWTAWDCCGQSTPVALVADVDHGKAVRFEINGSTVVGFSSRDGHGAEGGTVFDATDIKTTGTISFDLRMVTAPTAGVGVWKFKVESNGGGAGNAAEVDLSTSHEAHSAPVLNTWQTYTFDIADLETAGVNVSGLDVFMVFPAWSTGDGAEFDIDNVKIWATGATP